MFLALDIGNSHVVCAVHNKNKWMHSIRISSNLDFWTKFKSLNKFDITHAAISSVVPRLTSVYVESIRNIFHVESYIINYKNSGIELKVNLSATLEQALKDKLKSVEEESWKKENKAAIAAYNEFIAENGCIGDEYRNF